MLKSSCQTLTCQHCLVCHNCTTTTRGDLQGPNYWMVRQLHKTAGVHALQAASSPDRNKWVGHHHSDGDEKKMRFTQSKLSCGRPYINHKACKGNQRGQATSPGKKKRCNSLGRGGSTPATPSRLLQPSPGQQWVTTPHPQACGQGLALVIPLAGHHTFREGGDTERGYVCMCVMSLLWAALEDLFLKQAVQPVA